ncbi:MAG: SufE family protein [Micrococcales bacterium]
MAENLEDLVADFQSFDLNERLNLLLEYSEKLPELPERYQDHPDLLERVEECQSPVYLFVEVQDDTAHTVNVFFTAPAEAPTTRGFASILQTCLDGLPAAEVLDFQDSLPDKLGLTEAVSPLRIRGMRAMLGRIKRNVREKLS